MENTTMPGVWQARYMLYRNLGAANRSMLGAVHAYEAQIGAKKRSKNVSGAWLQAANKYRWQELASQYDIQIEAEQDERRRILFLLEQEEIEKILTTGYAAMHERVKALNRTAQIIEKSFYDEDGKINYKFLTPDKIREFRGCLDDIAKELGARARKTEVTGHNGGPIDIEITTEWGGGEMADATE